MGSPVKFGVQPFRYRPISPKVRGDIPERNLRISFQTLKGLLVNLKLNLLSLTDLVILMKPVFGYSFVSSIELVV